MTRTERRRRQQRRRRAAMQRAACLALALLAVAAAFAWSGRPQEQEAMETAAPVTATALPQVLPHQPRVRGKPAGRPAPGVRVFVLAKLA